MAASSRHILVVDDEPDNIRLIGNWLTAQGYAVHVAESGERALEIVHALDPDVRLDVILLDILMPGGMDGVETCRRLKSWPGTRNTPVIFLTGKDDQDTMLRAFAAGGVDYVLKPFNRDVLLARVQAHSRLGLLSSDLESALVERTRELQDANAKLRRLAMEVALIEEREQRHPAGQSHDRPRHTELDRHALSERERDVLRLLAEGKRTKDIADMLCISVKTVETYRSRLMLKLGIDNLPGLVKFAIRAGLTSPGI